MRSMSEYYFEPRNILPNGLTLLQINPDCAVDLRVQSPGYGWLYHKGEPDQWISVRRLEPLELRQAREQAEDSQVLRIVRCG
jgi:hypothetical protein